MSAQKFDRQNIIDILREYESGIPYKQLAEKYKVSERAIGRRIQAARKLGHKEIIRVEEIPHEDQRYPTCGDWQFIDGCLVIRVSRTSDDRYSYLLAIHEAIEAILCWNDLVYEKDVDKWDKEYKGDGEPGEVLGCPYYVQHMIASIIENYLAKSLRVNWDDYEKEIDSL